MTKSQTAKYWREWSKVRRVLIELAGHSPAEADAERHEIHRTALGQDKSSKSFSNRDLDAILDHFASYLVLRDGPQSGPSRAESQPIKRLVWAITQLGLPAPYIESISRAKFGTAEWQKLPLEDLSKLRFTLAARASAKSRISAP